MFKKENTNKIEELESIRGLAALLIVVFHIPKWNSFLNTQFINNGYLMVDLFFVLSGFVIFTAYKDKIISIKQLLRFEFLRFCRLYPVHLFFLFLFLLIELAKYIAVLKLGSQVIRSTPFNENSIQAFVQQLFLVQALGPTGNAATFNDPAWSISVEFYIYFFFGLIVLFFKKYEIYIFTFLVLFSSFLLLNKNAHGFTELLRCVLGFFIGCLTAIYVDKTKKIVSNHFSLLLFFCILFFLQIKNLKEFDLFIYLMTSFLIVSIVLSNDGFFKNLLRNKFLTWLGLISYSIYMSHWFVLWCMENFIKHFLKRPEIKNSDGFFVASLESSEAWIVVFSFIVLVLLVGQLTYWLIEKPFRERSRRFVSNNSNKFL